MKNNKLFKRTILFGLALLTSVGAQAQSETLNVWLSEEVAFTADSSTVSYLTLYENDPEHNYTSFNMSIRVPKGIQVNKVKKGRTYVNDIELSLRAAESHSIECSLVGDTLLKVACTSMSNEELFPDDEDGNLLDEVFTIGLIACPSMYNGTYDVVMPADGLVFNMKQGDTYVSSKITEDVTCRFVINGGVPTSLRQLPDGADSASDAYDLQGRRVKAPARGVYVKRGKKVVVK